MPPPRSHATGHYTLEWEGPRHVCRLIPLRRVLQTGLGDWAIRYDGYCSSVTVEATAQEFLFLCMDAEAEGREQLGNAERLAELGRAISQAVHTLLYDKDFDYLRQSLTIMYPVLVALPGISPTAPYYLPAVASALLFANGMLSTEHSQQLVLARPLVDQYGFDCNVTIQGLLGLQSQLRYTFATKQYIFIVKPIPGNGPMPLEVRGLWGLGVEGVRLIFCFV